MAVLSAIEDVPPSALSHGWAGVESALVPGIPPVTGLCLMSAAPLLPLPGLSGCGMGAAFGNRMPAMKTLLSRLRDDTGRLKPAQVSRLAKLGQASLLMQPRRQAYAAGYALTTTVLVRGRPAAQAERKVTPGMARIRSISSR